MSNNNQNLRFEGSIWCNLDIALRSMDQYFRQHIQPDDITVIEWYILRALYEEDGRHASELARAVGRAATSFTPNLDKLQQKGWVERRPDEADRRAVRIYLTDKARQIREDVLESAKRLDGQLSDMFVDNEFENFSKVLGALQSLAGD
ncbi:MAG: MarR family transcriptional regulator [Aggregatilineales bacterium]